MGARSWWGCESDEASRRRPRAGEPSAARCDRVGRTGGRGDRAVACSPPLLAFGVACPESHRPGRPKWL